MRKHTVQKKPESRSQKESGREYAEIIKKTDHRKIQDLLHVIQKLNRINDIDSLLGEILYQSRNFTHADAGSIFLIKDNQLQFNYVQNDTLSKRDRNNNRHIYSRFTVPIDSKSIAGNVALTGESAIIDDVYHLPRHVPYSFNNAFDKILSYRTQSMLAIPMKANQEVIGVMQIINAKDEHDNIIPFTEEDSEYVAMFANNASSAVEKAKIVRENILRMIKMAEMRDPKETGAHVNRVGAYSIEIYQKWAEQKDISKEKIKHYTDILRIAAMLHDVGKVAISDIILKKPGRLSEEEYRIIQTHAKEGAEIFDNPISEFDALASEIALTHHEKWDGSGYPRGLKGKEIPLFGRITALADVYDALISRRTYKQPWSEEKVIKHLKDSAHSHFDPELVDIFISIHDVIQAIRNKYPDEEK